MSVTDAPASTLETEAWSSADPARAVGRRAEIVAASACMALGLLFCVLPHIVTYARTGDPAWVGDQDDLIYLMVGSQAYHNHPFDLGDPSRAEPTPALASRAMLTPGIVVAKALGLGPMGIPLVWRALTGLSIGLAGYLLFRHYTGRAGIAAALTVILLGDIGVMAGEPLWQHGRHLLDHARGGGLWLDGLFRLNPNYWRVASPGTALPIVLVYLLLLARARDCPRPGRVAAAGAAFGLLFYNYFYYWTAAGLALVLGLIFDAGKRRVHLAVGAVGGLIGLPSVLAGLSTSKLLHPDALARIDLMVPIGRTAELFLSRPETGLLVLSLAWVVWRRRDLAPIAALALSGWLLVNHQLVSGLQLQNFHYRPMISKPATGLLILLIVAGLLPERRGRLRPAALVLWGVALACLPGGLYLRWLEATRAEATRMAMRGYYEYRALRRDPASPAPAPNAVVAGDEIYQMWASILDNQRPLYVEYITRHSMFIGSAELYRRAALNAELTGLGLDDLDETIWPGVAGWWGPYHRDPAKKQAAIAALRATLVSTLEDPAPALREFRPQTVAVAAGSGRPPGLDGGWRLAVGSPDWDVWERSAPASR